MSPAAPLPATKTFFSKRFSSLIESHPRTPKGKILNLEGLNLLVISLVGSSQPTETLEADLLSSEVQNRIQEKQEQHFRPGASRSKHGYHWINNIKINRLSWYLRLVSALTILRATQPSSVDRRATLYGFINPLSPGVKLQILLLCFHTFLTEVVGRSC